MRTPILPRASHICSLFLYEVFNYDFNNIHLQHDPEGFRVSWTTVIEGETFRFDAVFLDGNGRNGDIDVADGMTTSPAPQKEIHFVFLRQRSDGTWTYEMVPSTQRMAIRAFSAAHAFTQLVYERYGSNATLLSFSASRRYPSRVRLYRRIAQKLARDINGHVEERLEFDDIVFMIHLPHRHLPGTPPI